jgi:uncharacterized protein with FMN-binding domain
MPALLLTGAGVAIVGALDHPKPVVPAPSDSPASSGSQSSPASPAAPSTGSCTGTPVQGQEVQTRFGPVQVTASMDGSRLCSVSVGEYPSDRMRSMEINQQAIPILNREAVAAQSANIDIVSGATFTSDAYRQSLQSALDGH